MQFFRRGFQRFRNEPASIRHASVAIVSLTMVVVVIGAVVVRIFDRQEYPTFGRALWFTLQTVTTVGYGDVTPERVVGRVVAGVVMVTAIGLVTVVTAAITSVFIAAARAKIDRSDRSEDTDTFGRLESSLASIAERLDRLESTLAATTSDPERDSDGG